MKMLTIIIYDQRNNKGLKEIRNFFQHSTTCNVIKCDRSLKES